MESITSSASYNCSQPWHPESWYWERVRDALLEVEYILSPMGMAFSGSGGWEVTAHCQ